MMNSLILFFSSLKPVQFKQFHRLISSRFAIETATFKVFTFLSMQCANLSQAEVRSDNFSYIKHKAFLNILSSINLITEEFLITEYFRENHIPKTLLLNKIRNQNGYFKRANQKALKAERELGKNENLSIDKYENLSTLYHQQYYSDNPIKYSKGEALLEKLVKTELTRSCLQLLLYKCEMINWGKIKNHDYSELLEKINVVTSVLEKSILSDCLRKLANLLKDPNLDDFLSLRSVLYADQFACPGELHTIFTMYLLNINLKLWHLNIYREADESATLFEYALNTGVLLYNEKIPIVRFHNLINTLGV